MRVLIVEDDPAVRPFIDMFLTRNGFHTVTAPSAAQADALLLDLPGPLCVAVLDLRLPGIGGIAYADQLRARFEDIRFVFVTGWTEPVQEAEAQRRGRVLYKPFYPQELLDAIRFPA
jgi:DNA-binding response OmpR family regulator